MPPPLAPLLSSSGSARSSVLHPARSCRHVLKQAGYQPHDKSIGLFCNVIYIKASGAAGLKRSKMFSKSLSCLCLGGAINSTARTHQPSVPPSLSSATKGLSRRFFFLLPRKQSSRCRAVTVGEMGRSTHFTLIFSRETEKLLRENLNAVGAQQEGARCPSTAVAALGLSRGSYGRLGRGPRAALSGDPAPGPRPEGDPVPEGSGRDVGSHRRRRFCLTVLRRIPSELVMFCSKQRQGW